MAVVVGFSTKPEGLAAVSFALEEARMRHCAVILVPNSAADSIESMRAELAESEVDIEIAEPAFEGLIAENLLRVAEEAHADCIVIGLRRRSPTGKLLIGANAQRVLLDASCPVIAVKAAPE